MVYAKHAASGEFRREQGRYRCTEGEVDLGSWPETERAAFRERIKGEFVARVYHIGREI